MKDFPKMKLCPTLDNYEREEATEELASFLYNWVDLSHLEDSSYEGAMKAAKEIIDA